MNTTVLCTRKDIADLTDQLVSLHKQSKQISPIVYIDLEGVNLCRNGSISILTLLVHNTCISTKQVYIIDVHKLGHEAFGTAGIQKKTLKDILQDERIPKVFFDVRNDSDALYAHFNVALQGVEDIQLMESATRKTTGGRKLLNGLARCMEDPALKRSKPLVSLTKWKAVKSKGEKLFKPEKGGTYDVFNLRPLSEDILSYCISDVQYLPELRGCFWRQQSSEWKTLVSEETRKRVRESQQPDYEPKGRDRALSPWNQEQNAHLDRWNYVPPRRTLQDDLDELDNYYDDLDDVDEGDNWDYYDDGPTSCRDIIADCDYYLYYSD